MLSVRQMTSLLKRRQYCACVKSTVTSPALTDSDSPKPMKEMPGPRGRYAIPKIGSVFFMEPCGEYIAHTLYKLMDKLHDTFGRTISLELFGRCVVTADPNSIGRVFKNEGRQPRRPKFTLVQHYFKRNNRPPSLLLLVGDEWQRLRSAAQRHLLKKHSASVYINAQSAVTNDLITRMSTMTYTHKSSGMNLLNMPQKRLGFLDPNGRPITSEMFQNLEAIRTIFELQLKHIGPPIYKIFPTKLYKDFEKSANLSYGYGLIQIKEALAKTEREMKEGTFDPEKPNLMLQLLSNPDTTPESVYDMLLDLWSGSTNTTAKNMEFFLLNLAQNPRKQQKFYEEIFEVIGPRGNEIEAHNVSKMSYFRACMKESFRINFPVSFGALRVLPKEVVVDGYVVPKGTPVILNCRRICLSSEYFESPDKYIPERWLRDGDTMKKEKECPAFSLLPFGFGARNCIGRRFAEQQLWLGVTKIIQNFQVSILERDRNYEVIYTTFGQLKDPVAFTFTPR